MNAMCVEREIGCLMTGHIDEALRREDRDAFERHYKFVCISCSEEMHRQYRTGDNHERFPQFWRFVRTFFRK